MTDTQLMAQHSHTYADLVTEVAWVYQFDAQSISNWEAATARGDDGPDTRATNLYTVGLPTVWNASRNTLDIDMLKLSCAVPTDLTALSGMQITAVRPFHALSLHMHHMLVDGDQFVLRTRHSRNPWCSVQSGKCVFVITMRTRSHRICNDGATFQRSGRGVTCH